MMSTTCGSAPLALSPSPVLGITRSRPPGTDGDLPACAWSTIPTVRFPDPLLSLRNGVASTWDVLDPDVSSPRGKKLWERGALHRTESNPEQTETVRTSYALIWGAGEWGLIDW
jgi:hypothetical protein